MNAALHKIRKLRKAKKISQKEMAEELELSQPGYQKVEAGINSLSIDNFIKICTILEIESYEEILPSVQKDNKKEIDLLIDFCKWLGDGVDLDKGNTAHLLAKQYLKSKELNSKNHE